MTTTEIDDLAARIGNEAFNLAAHYVDAARAASIQARCSLVVQEEIAADEEECPGCEQDEPCLTCQREEARLAYVVARDEAESVREDEARDEGL